MKELTEEEKKMVHDFISLSVCSVFDKNPDNAKRFKENAKTICQIAGVECDDDFANELWLHIDSIRTGIAIAKVLK